METILTILSLIGRWFGRWFGPITKSDSVKFQRYKAKGLEAKESKQLTKALRFYKKALDHAEKNEQRADVWYLILHIHTDRTIAASQQWTNYTGEILEWRWGPNNIPRNYQRPLPKELIR